jgi:hypothetical protein
MRQYHQHGYNRILWVETIAINGERAKGVLHHEGIQGPWLTVNWGLSIAQTRGAPTPIQLYPREWMICDDIQNWEAKKGRTLQMAWIGKCSSMEMKVPPKSTGHRLWSINVQSLQKHKLPRVDGAIQRLPGGASVVALQEVKRAPGTGPTYVAGMRAWWSLLKEGKAGCALLFDPEFECCVRQDLIERPAPGRILVVPTDGVPPKAWINAYGPTGKDKKLSREMLAREIASFWSTLSLTNKRWQKAGYAVILFGDFNACLTPEAPGGRSSGKPTADGRDKLMKGMVTDGHFNELTGKIGFTWFGNIQHGVQVAARLDGIFNDPLGRIPMQGNDPHRWPSAPFSVRYEPESSKIPKLTDHKAIGVEIGMKRTPKSRLVLVLYLILGQRAVYFFHYFTVSNITLNTTNRVSGVCPR